jgi:hypothetical protein
MANFTSVLQAIGKGVVNYSPFALQVASGFMTGGVGGGMVNAIAGIVATTERAFEVAQAQNASPEQKMKAALPLTVDVIRNSELLAGRQIADEERFLRGAQRIQDGIVDLLDSIRHPGPVGESFKTPPPDNRGLQGGNVAYAPPEAANQPAQSQPQQPLGPDPNMKK